MMKRRTFIKQNLITVPLIVSGVNPFLESSKTFSPEQNLIKDGYKQIFNGKTLKGWHSAPRLPMPRFVGGTPPDKDNENYKKALTSKGLWTVQDGAIIGGQDPPGSGMGGYLVSDDEYGDFDLVLDARPDWPVDTGILIRAGSAGVPGIQVLLDHRKSGGIGGFYGNGLGGYHALAYNFDAKLDENGRPVGLMAEKPETTNEPVTDAKRNLLSYAAPVEEFLGAWKWDDWNTFRIRCVGKYPRVTTWINGVKIYELDTAKIVYPGYDKEEVFRNMGSKGHISFEVHDNDPLLGKDRWWPGAVCRWRNIYIKELL